MAPSPTLDDVVYADPRVGFWLLDRIRQVRHEGLRIRNELRALRGALEKMRLENPTLFDQLAVVALAAVLEVVVSYAKRKDAKNG